MTKKVSHVPTFREPKSGPSDIKYEIEEDATF